MEARECILQGQTALGIEFGSTRIKAVLIDQDGKVLAKGSHRWENSFEQGVWTYHLEDIHQGLRQCYRDLRQHVRAAYQLPLTQIGAIGISAMMHGYMALNEDGNLLAPFQTWRNTNTETAAQALTEYFHFNIPQRWTIAHLYQCMLDKEEHLFHLDYLTVLSSYIHWRLTGKRVVGMGDASGIFPVDPQTLDYDETMITAFNKLLADKNYPFKNVRDILPQVLAAGTPAGTLTAEGAAFLDDSRELLSGIPFCPPEGDAATGMVATNAVRVHTGNVSAGTSTFAMLVLDKPLRRVYPEIDIVATPSGHPVAMSHANNGTTDLNACVDIFKEFTQLMGGTYDTDEIYHALYRHSLKGDADAGGLLSYGYYSGENVTHFNSGRPLLVRTADSRFNLANLFRVSLYTSLGAVKMGLDILFQQEHVKVDSLTAHGGLFKTKGVAQRYLAAAAGVPVTVMETADEGGAWGEALLAAYMLTGKERGWTLEDYLTEEIFKGAIGETLTATSAEIAGFETFMERYRAGLMLERAAIQTVSW